MQTTLEDYLPLDIHKFKPLDNRSSTARWTQLGETIATMPVICSPERLLVGGQTIDLTYTPCHLGGQRAWFLCPVCASRRVKLYWDGRWLCRTCLGVPYACTLETDLARKIRKQRRLEDQLCRPIRRKKRKRLQQEWNACERYIQRQFEPMYEKLRRVDSELEELLADS